MITKDKLKQLLIEQRESLLEKPIGIERSALKEIEKKIKLPHIIVITGLRRSGKSTILRQIIKKYYNDEDFYYINFEDERFFRFNASEFNMIYETLVEEFGEKKNFFIDEIQNIDNFETFVRRFYDIGFKFFITGSNAKLLSKELGTKITGRHLDIVINPFSFEEFLKTKNFEFEKSMIHKTKTKAQLKKYFEDYLIKGGMPEYVLYEDPDILKRVYEDIVIKDVFVRYNLDNVTQLRELYQYIITNFSQKFSFNSLKEFINISSANTIKKYLIHLEDTYFAKMVNKFDYSLKKQIVNDKKLYVVDNAFISLIATKLTKDKGWLLENLVFNFLKQKGDIFYFSFKKECDFVVVENNSVKKLIQVTWNLTDTNKEREISGLIEAMIKFKIKKALILTYDDEAEFLIKGKKVIVKPVWKYLLEE